MGTYTGNDGIPWQTPGVVNLTPHAITLRDPEGVDHIIRPHHTPARVDIVAGALDSAAGCPVPVAEPNQYLAVTGLPDPVPGVLFVTSSPVASRALRRDVVTPGDLVRDEAGRVVACRRLDRWA